MTEVTVNSVHEAIDAWRTGQYTRVRVKCANAVAAARIEQEILRAEPGIALTLDWFDPSLREYDIVQDECGYYMYTPSHLPINSEKWLK